MQYSKFLTLMADGTIKQINPFTDNEVWCVPGRAAKPVANGGHKTPVPLSPEDFTSFCAFCPDRLFETPPEKSRLIKSEDGNLHHANHIAPSELGNTNWLFRR